MSVWKYTLCKILLCGSLLFLSTALPAANGTAAAVNVPSKVSQVIFEQTGGKPIVEDILRFNVRQQPGQPFSRVQLDDDVKRLYKLGYFSDVLTATERQKDGSLKLIFKLKLRPQVTEVIFDGNQKFKTDELANLTKISIGMPLNDIALRDSASALREFYRDKGYYDAEVAPVFEQSANNTIKVIFRIRENLKLKINDVIFEGNTVYSSWDLRHSLANRYSLFHWVPLFNLGLLDREALKIDRVRLRDMYWDRGYLDFKIEKMDIVQCEDDPEFVNITFKIFEGEPYKVTGISATGAKNFSDKEIMALIAIKPEETFDYRKENADRKKVLDLLHSEGFADATCQIDRQADYSKHEVKLVFKVNEGRQYHIDQVTIVGNEFTQEKVIRRELVVYPGDPADEQMLEVSKARLMNMDMFESVDASLVSANKLNEKDAVFKVREKNAYNVRVGGGFSDVDSLFGVIEASCRNFNIADPKNYFRGGGQRLRAQAAFGIERAMASIDFTEPWLFDIPLRMDLSVYLRQSIYEFWDDTRWGTRVAFSHKLFDDFTRGTVAYKFERVRIHKMDDHKLGPETLDEGGSSLISQFSLELDRTTLDSLTDPTEGYQINLLGAISPEIFGSSEDFYRVELKGMYVMNFFDKAIVWQTGAKLGIVSTFSSDRAPIYERYFLGGGDTLRGFPFRDVATLDSRGRPVGGDSMSLFTTEISHPIWSFIRGAVFADAGGVSKNDSELGCSHFNIGIGYGLRLKLPYVPMPIKLDLAYPILNNQDNVKNRLRFHFNMGLSF